MENDRLESYMRKLEERNYRLKDYIDKIERSLSRSRNKDEKKQDLKKNMNPKILTNNFEHISNAVYTNKTHPDGFAIYSQQQK